MEFLNYANPNRVTHLEDGLIFNDIDGADTFRGDEQFWSDEYDFAEDYWRWDGGGFNVRFNKPNRDKEALRELFG
jgi:hypothetical protein